MATETLGQSASVAEVSTAFSSIQQVSRGMKNEGISSSQIDLYARGNQAYPRTIWWCWRNGFLSVGQLTPELLVGGRFVIGG